jgi:hypothetical protein
MGAPISLRAWKQISEEIRRVVAEAIKDQAMVFCSDVARAITRDYPNSGFTEQELADEIAITAARAGVAVKIGSDVVLPTAEKSAGARRLARRAGKPTVSAQRKPAATGQEPKQQTGSNGVNRPSEERLPQPVPRKILRLKLSGNLN